MKQLNLTERQRIHLEAFLNVGRVGDTLGIMRKLLKLAAVIAISDERKREISLVVTGEGMPIWNNAAELSSELVPIEIEDMDTLKERLTNQPFYTPMFIDKTMAWAGPILDQL
jgi:hypothetical protein